jgi:hypothetical protein
MPVVPAHLYPAGVTALHGDLCARPTFGVRGCLRESSTRARIESMQLRNARSTIP